MGRISKRKSAEQQPQTNHKDKRYNAGIYARLSADHDEKQNESVEVQIEIAKRFVDKFNKQRTGEAIDVVECYTDMGKTGSNFERQGFQQLLQDIRLGEINCVIVKDLSRFGRNYLEAGNYIERIFPFLGVRFIAVADGFDTGKEGNANKQMTSEIKNLVNDMYAKDFSKKAKLHLEQRRAEGSYVGGPPPYGYKAEWRGKRRVLVPDENTETIVRFIFEKFAETENYAAVSDELNRRRINPPCLYMKTKEVYHLADEADYKGWNRGAVERILTSRTYTGILMQGRTSLTGRDEKTRIHKPEEEWVIIKDAHEPLIGEELFHKTTEIRQRIKTKRASYKHLSLDFPLEENIFDHVLYCGVCGKKMTRDSTVFQHASGVTARREGYFCSNSGQTKVTICPESNRISKNELLDILLPLVRAEFAVFLDKPKHYQKYGEKEIAERVKNTESKIHETEEKIRRFHDEEESVYMDYRAGKILQKDFVSFKMKQAGRLEESRKQQQDLEKEKKEWDKLEAKYLRTIKSLVKLKSGKDLTKEMVEAFISKIYIYPGKRIEILFAVTADGMKVV